MQEWEDSFWPDWRESLDLLSINEIQIFTKQKAYSSLQIFTTLSLFLSSYLAYNKNPSQSFKSQYSQKNLFSIVIGKREKKQVAQPMHKLGVALSNIQYLKQRYFLSLRKERD